MAALSTLILTHEHLIHAEVETAERRLLDVVSDGRTDFLRLGTAAIHRREDSSLVATASNVVMPKRSLVLLAPTVGRHEAPRKRYDNFSAKKEFDALLLVLGYEIFGKLQLNGSDDPAGALTNELTKFFPVAAAEVYFRGVRTGTEAPSVVIVNSAFVSLLRIGEFVRPPAEAPLPLFAAAPVSEAARLHSAVAGV